MALPTVHEPTTLAAALQQLAQQQQELERLRAYVQDMGKVLAHDLRAPLRHVVSFAPLLTETIDEMLSSGSADPQLAQDAREFAELMAQSSRKMADMVAELVQRHPCGQ